MAALFHQISALVVSGFSGFSKASATIITRNVNNGGGVAEMLQGKPKGLDKFTHIIVPSGADEGKLADVLGVNRDELESLMIVSQDWAVDSARFRKLADTEKYRWRKSTPAPQVVAEPEAQPVKRAKTDSGSRAASQSRLAAEAREYAVATPPRESFSTTFSSPAKSLRFSPEGSDEEAPGTFEELLARMKGQSDASRFIAKSDAPTSLETQDYWEKQKHTFLFAKGVQSTNLNEHITSVLEKLTNNYQILKDKGRYFAYREAVNRLKAHPERIHCSEQVRGMARFGEKMIRKISEILETGTLQRVQSMEQMEYLKAMKELTSVWGIGSATADKLYKLGYRTVADLKARPSDILNASQAIGLEFYDEIAEKMPREEVKAICDLVEAAARARASPRQLLVVPCGSYRRGRALCGDADVLITFADMEPFQGFLNQLVEDLMGSGLITHRLQISDHWEPGKKHSHEMFAGVAQLPGGKHRRLDIKMYPRKSFAWALMHFTGSANFNRSIRLFAKKKGFKLTDEGFFVAYRDKEETYHGENSPICYTEEDIFRLFGIEYKTPEERDF